MASSNAALTGDSVADEFLSGASAPDAAPPNETTGDAVADAFLSTDKATSDIDPVTGGKIKKGPFGISYIDPATVPTPKRVMPKGADSPAGLVAHAAIDALTGLPLEVAGGLTGLASLPWGKETAARNIAAVRGIIPAANTDPMQQSPAAAATQAGLESPLNVLNLPSNVGKGVGLGLQAAGVPEGISTPVGQATTDVGSLLLGAKGAQAIPEAEGSATEAPTGSADYGYTNKSGGAAATGVDLTQVSPELRSAVEQARTQGPVHNEVLANHIKAETLPLPAGETPIRLTAGRATGDVQQLSDERNMRGDPATQGILANLEAENNRKLVSSMEEIRGNATPDVVHRNNLEHGQQAITDIKTEQNARMNEISGNYKALADANGGAMPIDSGSLVDNVQAKLSKNYLTRTAASTPAVAEILDSLKAGEPFNFESFEAARSRLAEVQRGGGSAAAAAGIVRNELESLPLSAEAKNLKGLADRARASAKAMFDDREHNPAYEAVFNDNVPKVNGRHDLEAASPLADTFMQRYVTGNGGPASRANILKLHELMKDQPEFKNAVQAATLNNLRQAAGINSEGSGGFNAATYNRARAAIEPKVDALLHPDVAAQTQQLGEVANLQHGQPKGSFVNNSATAIAQQRMRAQEAGSGFGEDVAHLATHAATAALGPAAGIANAAVSAAVRGRAARKAAAMQAELEAEKLNFAQEATAPGAGLNYRGPR